MYGHCTCHILGRLTEDVVLREKDGRKYCYFSVAINSLPYKGSDGEKVTPPTLFLDCSASGLNADILAKRGKKGVVLSFQATPSFKTNTVEKDGTKTVYKDVIFSVPGGTIIDYIDDKKPPVSGDTAQESYNKPAPAAPAPAPKTDTTAATPQSQGGFDLTDDPDLLAALDELPI